MPAFANSVAVIIGINQYGGGIPPLSTPVNDAQELARILEREHQYRVLQLLDAEATRSALHHLLDIVLPQEVHPDDRLLFYFAGHGIALNGKDGPEGYLIPQDVKLGDTNNYLPMAHVQECLSALPCRHFLGLLDCCFAGAFRWSSARDLLTVPEVLHKERYERFIQDPAWQVIASAGYDQKAFDALPSNADRGQIGAHSPFAAALLDALTGKADCYPPAANGTPAGDGVITATELYLYVRNCVEPATEGQGQRQTPVHWPLKKHDKGEYIFRTPGHILNLPLAPPLDASHNPYRGLQAFEEEHHDVFFGRQALIDGTEDTPGLYTSVQNHPVTVVLGASGSGKSSLVKAGLLPHVRQIADAADPPQWRILPPLRPGGRPFQALQTLLQERILGTPGTKATDGNTSEHLVARMAAWCRQHPTAKLLLVIDQLEEVLTVCQDQQERENFCTVLAQALDQYPEQLRLVLTLRSDFEPQVQDTALKACWQNAARFVVRPMTRAELRDAIEEPATKRVLYFHSDDPKNPLVDQLITEVVDMPGALPLLSFTLSELYLKYLERQKVARDQGDTIDRAITEADYKALGGVARSLTQRAEQEYDALVHQDPAYAHTIRHVMLRMVAGSGGEVARRQVPVSELVYPPDKNERVQEVIQRFSAARLVVEGKNTAGHPYVEPAHDVLVRGWHRLETWQKEQGESVILQRQVTPAAEEWHRQQKARFLWNANPRLDLLKQVLHAEDNWLNQVEGEFVQRSVRKKRQNTLVGWSIAGSVICILSAILLVVFIQLQQTDLREKAARVRILNQPTQKLVLAIEATGQSQSILKPFLQSAFGQVQSSLAYAIEVARERNAIELKEFSSVAISRDGQYIATSTREGRLCLWNLQGKEISKYDGIKEVNAISFSPNGQTILIKDDKQLHLWDWKSNLMQDIPVSEISDDNIKAIFMPEGSMMVTRSNAGLHLWDGKGNLMQDLPKGHMPEGSMMVTHSKAGLHLWDGKSQQTRDLPPPKGEKQRRSDVSRAAFSPDGQKIVGLRDLHTKPVRLWNLHTQPDPSVDFSTSTEGLSAEGFTGGGVSMPNIGTAASHSIFNDYIAFTSDGQKIVSSSTDSNKGLVILTLWNLRGQVLDQLSFYSTDGISISADGKYAVTGQKDKVKLWDIGGKSIASFSSDSDVKAVSISPDGKTIAGGDRLWNLQGDSITVAHNRNEAVSLVAISHDGKTIAGGIDGRVRLWDVQGTLISDFPAYTFEVESIALSADGHTIVTSGQDKLLSSQEIRLWDRQGNLITQNFEGLKKEDNEYRWGRVAISVDGHTIVGKKDASTLQLWDRQGKAISTPFQGHTDHINAVAMSADGKTIVSGSDDATVRLWDRQGHPIGEPFQTPNPLSVAISDDGEYIVTGGSDGGVRLWDRQGNLIGDPMMVSEVAVTAVAISYDKSFIVSNSAGAVWVWRVGTWRTWLQIACDRLRDHPVLVEPETEVAQGAGKVCQKYVWDKMGNAQFLVKQGRAQVAQGDVKGAVAKFNQARKLDSSIEIPSAIPAEQRPPLSVVHAPSPELPDGTRTPSHGSQLVAPLPEPVPTPPSVGHGSWQESLPETQTPPARTPTQRPPGKSQARADVLVRGKPPAPRKPVPEKSQESSHGWGIRR